MFDINQLRMEPHTEELPPCKPPENHPKLSLAIAYVPMQEFRMLYDPPTGFDRGTIFQELDLPFIGEEVFGNER